MRSFYKWTQASWSEISFFQKMTESFPYGSLKQYVRKRGLFLTKATARGKMLIESKPTFLLHTSSIFLSFNILYLFDVFGINFYLYYSLWLSGSLCFYLLWKVIICWGIFTKTAEAVIQVQKEQSVVEYINHAAWFKIFPEAEENLAISLLQEIKTIYIYIFYRK